MYCQRFLLQPLLSNSFIIILILSHHFKSLFEKLTFNYIFDYPDFTENLSNYNLNGFRSSFYHESISSNRIFHHKNILSNRSEKITTAFHLAKVFFNDCYIDSNFYDSRSFLASLKMSYLTFILYNTFSDILSMSRLLDD